MRRAGSALIDRLRHPRTTVRWRLTLLYGGLFLICGVALLAITYTLVERATVSTGPSVFFRGPGSLPVRPQAVVGPGNGSSPTETTVDAGGPGPRTVIRKQIPSGQATAVAQNQKVRLSILGRLHEFPGPLPPGFARVLNSGAGKAVLVIAGSQQRISDLHQLEVESAIALAIMVLVSGWVGWVIAGRVLRPLRTITTTTQQISAANLNQRLALNGPPDELRGLADTIDDLLARLEGAFNAQRRFVANASHEMRTPLTSARAMLEMVISDPNADTETFRETCRMVLEENDEQERLIDALLVLAQGQRGIERAVPIDLADVARTELPAAEREAAVAGVELEASLAGAQLSGDRMLVERLVSNLLENAVRHNVSGGHVRIAVEPRGEQATLSVQNTGPVVPPEEIERLLQPFQRLDPTRVADRGGLGLGLSIVAAIAGAHHAELTVEANEDGGLTVQVCFPRAVGPGSDPGTSKHGSATPELQSGAPLSSVSTPSIPSATAGTPPVPSDAVGAVDE